MANELKKIQNRIYKTTNTYTGNLYSDDAWQHVKELIGIIKSVEGVNDVIVGAGQYHNYINKTNPTDSAYRDYETTVTTDFGNLYGYIRCCAAGRVDDPFSSYDMVISLYPDRERDKLCERKLILTRKQLQEVAKRLEEDDEVTITTTSPDNSVQSAIYAAKKMYSKTGLPMDKTKVSVETPGSSTSSKDNDGFVNVPIKRSGEPIGDPSLMQQTQNQTDMNYLVDPQTTNENKTYTKKQLEEIRINNIKKNGVVKTKKQLEEEFKTRN